jgi:mono/diheme cytochrome c family protein
VPDIVGGDDLTPEEIAALVRQIEQANQMTPEEIAAIAHQIEQIDQNNRWQNRLNPNGPNDPNPHGRPNGRGPNDPNPYRGTRSI